MSTQEAIKELSNVSIAETPERLGTRINKARAILESEPEPGEFTKDARFQMSSGTLPITERYVSEDGHYYIPADIINLYFQACDRIDRLSAENKELKNRLGDLRAKSIRKGLMNHGNFTGKEQVSPERR